MNVRPVVWHKKSMMALEGAGVVLHRAFGYPEKERFDPFLLLDDFRSNDPSQYRAGFPYHPHRGIDTITIMLEGSVEHEDSLGNRGIIMNGGAQWMTAGSGIIHQEMPKPGPDGAMGGFQLWANMPAAHKMDPPRYRELTGSDIPQFEIPGASIRLLSGTLLGKTGAVTDTSAAPTVCLVTMDADNSVFLDTPADYNAFIYIAGGSLSTEDRPGSVFYENRDLLHLGTGSRIALHSGRQGAFLLIGMGRPLGEPIAWQGPIVMNTTDELDKAFRELREGTFLKHKPGFKAH